MKISICMPVMRRPKMLCQALHSILAQGHEDWELVIKDQDPLHPVSAGVAVGEIFRYLQDWGDKLKYFIGPNTRIFGGANECLARATGDILYVMGSDDFLAPGALESVNEVFEKDRFGGPLWLYGQTVSADALGRWQGVDGEVTTYAQMLEKNRIGLPSVFWNRQLMDLAGKFDTRYKYATDYELWLRFYLWVEPVFLLRQLGIYRHHDGQESRVYAQDLEREAEHVRLRYANFADVIRRARNLAAVKIEIPETIN